MPTVLLAGLFHETHSFLDDTTSLADFETRLDRDLEAARGDSSPLGGVFEVAERCGWRLLPAVDFRASPGGVVEDGAFEVFWGELEPRLLRSVAARLRYCIRDSDFLVHDDTLDHDLLERQDDASRRKRRCRCPGQDRR